MSYENERSAPFWDEEDETEIAAREAYLKAFNQKPVLPPSGTPSNTSEPSTRRPRPRGVPGSADFYEEIEGEERPARPRPTRQSREEVEARLRQQQRGRQAAAGREQERPRFQPEAPERRPAPQNSGKRPSAVPRLDPAHQSRPTRDFARETPRTTRDFSSPRATRDFSSPRATRDFTHQQPGQRGRASGESYDDSGEIEIIEVPLPPPQRRGRGVFSTLLIGCAGGLLTLLVVAVVLFVLVVHNTPIGQSLGVGKSTFSQPGQQNLALGNSTQVIVKNQAGKITINVDQSASAATLSSVKHVQASGQGDADNQFKQIKLSITTIAQGGDPTCLAASCLLISATTPAASGGLFGGGSDSVDLTIILPASFNSPNIAAPNIISASAGAGTVAVSGFNGVLNLNGTAGTADITVAHSLIFASSCIQTLHGNITIAQGSIFDLATPSNLIPCSNAPSSDPHRPWFMVKSGVGNVNITLTGKLDNLLLDANTNDGKITDDFNLNITASDGSATYHGPLVPNTNPTASLYVAASTGDITLHKQP